MAEMVVLSLRLPKDVHAAVLRRLDQRPELSINAVIVQTLREGLVGSSAPSLMYRRFGSSPRPVFPEDDL